MSPADEPRFPWLPVCAPILTAIVLWLVTGSALSLLFGAMSPVMLLAQFFENRLHARRRREHDARERVAMRAAEHATREAERSAEEERRREQIEAANRANPSAKVLRDVIHVARLVPARTGDPQPIRLGTDESGIPMRVDARDGIHFAGLTVARRDVFRAATAQLWWTTGDVSRSVTDGHGDGIGSGEGSGVAGRRDHGCRWLVTVVSASEAHVFDRDAPAQPAVALTPDILSAADLAHFRHRLSSRHHRGEPTSDAVREFAVDVGITRQGVPFEIDLIADGPHAAISGMTGSGKTSFLVRWLTELAQRNRPEGVELAVIDFKGGIDLAPLLAIPQCVGFATDLDVGHIDRALVGLQAEILRREKLLRGGQSVSEIPRLVVVLDEFRATASAHPLAIAVVADMVARGRALGMHVVLSTQRASSSFSDDILANVPLRIAFRSLTAHESTYLVGDARAYTHLRDRGDAVVAHGGEPGIVVRMHPPSVLVTPDKSPVRDAEPITSLHPISDRRVWMPPLPARIARSDVQRYPPVNGVDAWEAGHALCIGLADTQFGQRWESTWFSPEGDGHLLVTGTARAGRSTTLRSIVDAARSSDAPRDAVVIADEFHLWDWLDARCQDRHVRDVRETGDARPRLVIVDGIERMLANLGPENRDVLSERLMRSLRAGVDARLVISCDAESAWVTRLAPVCAARLDLVGAHQPGRARWKNEWIQVPWLEAIAPTRDRPSPGVIIETPVVVVDGFRRSPGGTLIQQHDGVTGVAGVAHANVRAHATIQDWCERSAEFTSVTRGVPILVRGEITPADERLLLRRFAPVPPMAVGQSILLRPDGGYHRVST